MANRTLIPRYNLICMCQLCQNSNNSCHPHIIQYYLMWRTLVSRDGQYRKTYWLILLCWYQYRLSYSVAVLFFFYISRACSSKCIGKINISMHWLIFMTDFKSKLIFELQNGPSLHFNFFAIIICSLYITSAADSKLRYCSKCFFLLFSFACKRYASLIAGKVTRISALELIID